MYVPDDLIGWIKSYAKKLNFIIPEDLPEVELSLDIMNPKLHPYQKEDVRRIITYKSYLLSYDMGVGKTPATIEVIRQLGPNLQTVIVCPAMVRNHWEEKLGEWWPKHGKVVQFTYGKQKIPEDTEIIITSYELVGKLPDRQWTTIVLDELHALKNIRTSRSTAIDKLCASNPGAYRIGLTATPIANEPVDVWMQLNLLWPSRFGNYYSFVRRYCLLEHNEYTKFGKPYGIDEDHADELRMRLDQVCSRVTKSAVAKFLPPLNIYVERIENFGHGDLKLFDARFNNFRKHTELIGQHLEKAGDAKIDAVLAKALALREKGASHICILTHRKQAAKDIAAEFSDSVVITGEIIPTKRAEAIQKATKQKTAVIVATMHSIQEGIDLTFCPKVIYAELYWQPKVVIQSTGRFHRLTSTGPVDIYIPVLEGTLDERIGFTLKRKIDNANTVLEGTDSGEKMMRALSPAEIDEDEFLELLDRAARSGS
jgi:SNF2 family DNA or RNA helicase